MGIQTTASGSALTLLCDPGSSTLTRTQADAWFRHKQALKANRPAEQRLQAS